VLLHDTRSRQVAHSADHNIFCHRVEHHEPAAAAILDDGL